MCLIDKKRFRFTIFSKICYKTFIFNSNTRELRNMHMQDIRVESRILTPNSNDEPEFESGAYKYTKGFIHAFYLQPFKTAAYLTLPTSDYIFYTFKCIIPPFTRYAVDIFGKSICARRMIIIDKLAKHVFD